MTEIKGYKCDYCGTMYEESFEATKCELGHVKIKKTNGIYKQGEDVPRELVVFFENGRKCYFKYIAEVG